MWKCDFFCFRGSRVIFDFELEAKMLMWYITLSSISFVLGVRECSESYEEDDMVPDSQIMEKGPAESKTPLQATVVGRPADPTIQKLAHQMQLAGDALTSQYGSRVTVWTNVMLSTYLYTLWFNYIACKIF